MEGFNQPPNDNSKKQPAKPQPQGRSMKRKADAEYSTNPRTVKSRVRQRKLLGQDEVSAGLEKAKNADRNAVYEAQRKLRAERGWPSGRLEGSLQAELDKLKLAVLHRRTVDQKSAQWYMKQYSLDKFSGHYAIEDDGDPNYIPVPFNWDEDMEFETLWQVDDKDEFVPRLDRQLCFREWSIQQSKPMSKPMAKHTKGSKPAKPIPKFAVTSRPSIFRLMDSDERMRAVYPYNGNKASRPPISSKTKKAVRHYVELGPSSPAIFYETPEVLPEGAVMRSTQQCINSTAFREWQADWKKVMTSFDYKLKHYTAERVILKFLVEQIQRAIEEEVEKRVPQLNWPRVFEFLKLDLQQPRMTLERAIIRRYLRPEIVFHPQEIALYRNLTTHPKALTKDKKGGLWYTMPGPSELWSATAMARKEFRPMPTKLRDGCLAAFWLVLSEEEDLEAFQHISLGTGEDPILYVNSWIA